MVRKAINSPKNRQAVSTHTNQSLERNAPFLSHPEIAEFHPSMHSKIPSDRPDVGHPAGAHGCAERDILMKLTKLTKYTKNKKS